MKATHSYASISQNDKYPARSEMTPYTRPQHDVQVSRKIIVVAKNATPKSKERFVERRLRLFSVYFIYLRRDFPGARISHEPRWYMEQNGIPVRSPMRWSSRWKPSSEVIEMQSKISTAIGPKCIHVLSGPRSAWVSFHIDRTITTLKNRRSKNKSRVSKN